MSRQNIEIFRLFKSLFTDLRSWIIWGHIYVFCISCLLCNPNRPLAWLHNLGTLRHSCLSAPVLWKRAKASSASVCSFLTAISTLFLLKAEPTSHNRDGKSTRLLSQPPLQQGGQVISLWSMKHEKKTAKKLLEKFYSLINRATWK